MCGCLLCTLCWGPGPQPRHVPDLQSNQPPFGLQACAQSTELRQPGQKSELFLKDKSYLQLCLLDYHNFKDVIKTSLH